MSSLRRLLLAGLPIIAMLCLSAYLDGWHLSERQKKTPVVSSRDLPRTIWNERQNFNALLETHMLKPHAVRVSKDGLSFETLWRHPNLNC
jgi:hypothetical protein